MARPMPRPAPVTRATESLSSMAGLRRRSYPGVATPARTRRCSRTATCAMLAASGPASERSSVPWPWRRLVAALPGARAGGRRAPRRAAPGEPRGDVGVRARGPAGRRHRAGRPAVPARSRSREPGRHAGFPGHGTGWYRVTFDLDPSLASVPLAFACPQIRDVDEVFLDGQPVGRTGEFPPDYDKGTVVERIYELPPSRTRGPRPPHARGEGLQRGPARGRDHRARPASTPSRRPSTAGRCAKRPGRLLARRVRRARPLLALLLPARPQPARLPLLLPLDDRDGALFIVSWLSFWTVSGLPLTFLFRVGHAGMFAVPAMTLLLFLKFFERPLGRGTARSSPRRAPERWPASSGPGPTTSTTSSPPRFLLGAVAAAGRPASTSPSRPAGGRPTRASFWRPRP